MKSKSSSKSYLFLIEILFSIFIFAVFATIYLGIISEIRIKADESKALNSALIAAQNAAESFKAFEGDLQKTAQSLNATINGDVLVYKYDNLNVEMTVKYEKESEKHRLLSANIIVYKTDDDLKNTVHTLIVKAMTNND